MRKKNVADTESRIERVSRKAKDLLKVLQCLNEALEQTRKGIALLKQLPDLASAACHLNETLLGALEVSKELPTPEALAAVAGRAGALGEALQSAEGSWNSLPGGVELADYALEARDIAAGMNAATEAWNSVPDAEDIGNAADQAKRLAANLEAAGD